MALLASLVACGGAGASEPEARRHEFTRLLMGVDVRVIVWSSDEGEAREGAGAAFDRIAAIEDVASDWRPSSEVMRLVRAQIDRESVISDDLWAMLDCAQRVAFASGGAFDVTIGPVTHLWREAARTGRTPDAAELESARARVGFRALVLDPEQKTVRLARPGLEIDLGGIAQGYAAGEALRVLDARGLASCCVDVSGDLALGDAPPGTGGWRVAVPDSEGWRVLTLVRCAVSTSGVQQGVLLLPDHPGAHIVDPRTGLAAIGPRSVTVVASDAMLADAMATAVFAMPGHRGLDLAERIPDLEAMVVGDEPQRTPTIATSGFPEPSAP